jgi:hypothetical protein
MEEKGNGVNKLNLKREIKKNFTGLPEEPSRNLKKRKKNWLA